MSLFFTRLFAWCFSAEMSFCRFVDFVSPILLEETAIFPKCYKNNKKNDDDIPQVILGVRECRQDEEGDYKCVLRSKEHGEIDFDFKLFVTVEGGMDFR